MSKAARLVGLPIFGYLLPRILVSAGIPLDRWSQAVGEMLVAEVSRDLALNVVGLVVAIALVAIELWKQPAERLLKKSARWRKKFEVIYTGVGYGIEPKRLEAKARIRFLRDIKNARLTLRIHRCTGLNRAPLLSVPPSELIEYAEKGSVKDIVLATLAISYPGWAPWDSTMGPPEHNVSLIGSSRNVIELELRTRFVRQRTKFFVENMSYGSNECGPALYVQSEDEDIFKV